ncbi:MAG: UvrD-helicase domain-containing protein [Bacilli bacterium]|nr:UvrD-helicase domain-containing protein [Bacilli bacterium]
MAWTPEQQQAIDLEGKNIIVSAGAGSGKTAVLTARTLRKLQSGIHVNELLILTFTNAAAAEMKERIRKAINKTPGLEEEANLIDGAYITTFDSFSLSIVKKYHTKLNVTSNIKITDEVVIDIEKNRILDEIMDKNYLSPKEDFTKLIQNFCLKDDKELKEYILNTYKKIELKYDKEKYLENYFNEEFTDEKLNSYINEYLKLIDSYRKNISNLIIELNDYFDGDYVASIEDALSKLLHAKTYEEIYSSLDFKLKAVPRGSDEEGKRIKETITELTKEIKNLAIYESVEEMKEEILSTKSNAKVIIDIIKELDKELTLYKQEHELYNFTDIARLAIKVVDENRDIKEELTNSFNEILVDEYQDTSDTQEKFISLISNNNVYMVGDIKQSIYRFRNANPYIFKNKYDTYRDTDAGIKIDLVKNFRSRKEVLENINLLFDLFMDDEIGGADYKASHRMVFGNTSYIEQGYTEQNYNLDVLTYKEVPKPYTKDEQEAFIIGQDIIEKITNKFQAFDKDTGILRDIEYKDFVILLDKSKNFDLYKKIFEYLHIPLTILKDEALRKDQDILVLKNLLNLLICIKQNNFQEEFKYSFTSISRSYLFKISDEELYDIHVNNSYKETALYKKCLEVLDQIDLMSPASYLDYILDKFNYDECLLTIGNVKSFRIRTEYFYNLIKSFEENGNTIYDFAKYLDEIFDNDYDLKFSINTSSANSCKIMTIHKSKGLEFPICYFAGFSGKFNTMELKEKIIYDNKYGLVIQKVDEYYKDTILKTLLKNTTKKEEISEKIRLLYVAVTRAKEKMIIVMPEQEETKEVLDIVPAYERNKYNSFLSIVQSIYSALLPFEIKKDVPITRAYQISESNTSLDELKEENDLLQVEENTYENEELEETHYSKESLHLITKEEQQVMDFGTKVHEVLEQMDFTNPNEFLEYLPTNIQDKIKFFLETPLIKENLSSKMYKEYEFTYQEGNTISHGIIDLLIEREDKMIIVDYKLKNIEDAAYDKQLNGYRKVIKEKTNKETECYLYSIIDSAFRKIEE